MSCNLLQCIIKGVDFIKGSVTSLLQNCDSLKRKHDVDFIVNCTGVDAGKLVQDDRVYPMLGKNIHIYIDWQTSMVSGIVCDYCAKFRPTINIRN